MTADRQQIGEVAERVGLSLRTVRYYEEQGLVAPEARTEGGFRLYTDEQVERLELIKRMKPLGLTINDMRMLFEARETLRNGTADEGARSEAAVRLATFAAEAAARCEELRAQVANAEAFAAQMRREADAANA